MSGWFLAVALLAQRATGLQADSPAVRLPAVTTAVATRALRPPVIDGREDDAVWRAAAPITDFREVRPAEGAAPKLRTQAKAAYDAHNLFVFVRAYDPHPDSIARLLARRDVATASDLITIFVDSYHDRRTAYEFAVNPAGVRLDYAVYNDRDEDIAWDGVWEAATRVDSLGWAAEFRIPLSQLRYTAAASDTFGFAIARDITRYTERVSWPLYRVSRAGLVSQFGELVGLQGLGVPRRLEVAPYVVAKDIPQPAVTGFSRRRQYVPGGDLKYRIGSNLTLNGTANPDFGQVEADPAVLNLTAFETFFQERRPFFVEGTGLFRLDVNCNELTCNGEGLFYSRRLGRSPQLAGAYRDENSPTATTILGAGKLTGRLASGLSLGVLEAVTERMTTAGDTTIEPLTSYAVLRVRRDYWNGESTVGAILTAVDRALDQWTEPYLRRTAYVGALDLRRRPGGGRYELSASFALSRVSGSSQAIAATQADAVHYYQRPDGGLTFDSTRTSLWGDAEELKFGKVGGDHLLFQTSYQRQSPGFEVNDLGFLLRADRQSWSNWVGFRFNHPRAFYERAYWNLSWWQWWTSADLPLERGANLNVVTQLKNRWWVNAGATLGQLGTTWCDRCTRGGPAVRADPYVTAWAGIQGDDRRHLVPFAWGTYWRTDRGRSEALSVSSTLDLKLSAPVSVSLNLTWAGNRNNTQWYGNFRDEGVTHYTFAALEQETLALTWRLNCTLTPNISLQLYAQPLVSQGTYGDVRELMDPSAAAYADRYKPYADTAVTNSPGGFNFKQFRWNTVFRWEYRSGSTLFLVWTQGRQDFAPAAGMNAVTKDFRGLFDLHPANAFLAKVSYWLNW